MRSLCAAALVVLVAGSATAQKPAPPPAPSATDGWVVLAVADYRALREKAYPVTPPPAPPPVAATISRIDYELNVQADAAFGQARLTVDVFKDGWVSVPIPAGLRVRDARLDGRPVPLANQPDASGRQAPAILLSRTGRAIISLDISVPITARAGSETMVLPASPTPVERLTLTLRSPDLALAVNGGLVAERTPGADSVRFLVCGRVGEPLTLSWSRRREVSTASQPLRLRGSVTELVGLAEDSAQVSAQVSAEVIQGLADRLKIKVPAGFTANQVSGALVADWVASGDEIIVSLIEPVDKSVSLTLTGESRIAREGRIQVPMLRLASAERETGGVAVEVLGAGEIKDRVPRGLDPGDPSDLGAMVAARQSPALVAFRSRAQAWDAPRSLEVAVARYTPQAILMANIEQARYTALASEDGKLLVESAFAVRNTQRSFVAVTLPADAVLWSASVDNDPVRPGRAANGALLLPLLRDRGNAERASLVRVLYLQRGTAWPGAGPILINLPAIDLPVSRSSLQLHYSPRYRITLEPGAFRPEEFDAQPLLANNVRAGASSEQLLDKDSRADQEMRSLIRDYQRAPRGGGTAGLLPIEIQFPAIGPSAFYAAELLPEGKSPEVRLSVKREVK